MKKYLVLLVALLMGSLMVSAENICKQGGGVGYEINELYNVNSMFVPSIKFTLYNSNPYEVTVHGWVELNGKMIGGKFSVTLPAANNYGKGEKAITWESKSITSYNKGDYSLGGPARGGLVYVETCN